MIRPAWPICVLLAVGRFAAGAWAAEPAALEKAAGADEAAAKFFESSIRPVLAARCYECHGPDSKREGNLRLDSRAAMLKGGDLGPAIKPGDPQNSLLIDAVRHGDVVQMPPKTKLPAREIADLTAWVAQGAAWPGSQEGAPSQPTPKSDTALDPQAREFWAFQPPSDSALPPVRDTSWPASTIDFFVLSALEARGLAAAPPADKRQLIRRATFDLHGLPPTPEEVDNFLADTTGDAFARLVDRLLASPRYGERWGRRWLDIARYADSNGMDENMAMAHAWRYRDYVVAAFNRDLPYDEFIRQQLAGDLLPTADDATNFERLVATGFLVLGPKMLAEDDPVKMEMDIVDEQVDTIGRAFMGLTLGCARCHDHKFDPIPTSDYYSLAGIFKSTKSMENYRVVAMWSERPLANSQELARLAEFERQVVRVDGAIKTAEQVAKDDATEDFFQRLFAGALVLGEKPGAGPKDLSGYYSPENNDTLAKLKAERAELEKSRPDIPYALGVSDRTPQDLRVHLRGSHLTLGELAPRRFPAVLVGESQPAIAPAGSGRLELARWLTRPDHPLTARVMVNRVWQGHFGEGLVRTPDNFGKLGQRPDNQPLLDWLAVRFVDSGWSIKALHRRIMLSSAYRMSTKYSERGAADDPENRLLWRMNRRRLEAEEIRDAILATCGGIHGAMGGTLLANKNHTYVTSTASANDVNYDNTRRSIYLPVVRSAVYEVFSAFDFADPSTMNGKRPATTVAPQALFMMNSPLVLRQTRALAEELLRTTTDDAALAVLAYRRVHDRSPSADETGRAIEFIARYQSGLAAGNIEPAEARVRAWQALCRVLISSNEFMYLE
jgi:cytochrome c553